MSAVPLINATTSALFNELPAGNVPSINDIVAPLIIKFSPVLFDITGSLVLDKLHVTNALPSSVAVVSTTSTRFTFVKVTVVPSIIIDSPLATLGLVTLPVTTMLLKTVDCSSNQMLVPSITAEAGSDAAWLAYVNVGLGVDPVNTNPVPSVAVSYTHLTLPTKA